MPATKAKLTPKRLATFAIYRDQAGRWRWRLQTANNRIIGDSGGWGYRTMLEAQRAVRTVREAAAGAKVIVRP